MFNPQEKSTGISSKRSFCRERKIKHVNQNFVDKEQFLDQNERLVARPVEVKYFQLIAIWWRGLSAGIILRDFLPTKKLTSENKKSIDFRITSSLLIEVLFGYREQIYYSFRYHRMLDAFEITTNHDKYIWRIEKFIKFKFIWPSSTVL